MLLPGVQNVKAAFGTMAAAGKAERLRVLFHPIPVKTGNRDGGSLAQQSGRQSGGGGFLADLPEQIRRALPWNDDLHAGGGDEPVFFGGIVVIFAFQRLLER